MQGAAQSSCQLAGFYRCCASIAKPQGILEAQGTFFLRPCVRPLRQESCPLGLTHPPGGQTDDHETDL